MPHFFPNVVVVVVVEEGNTFHLPVSEGENLLLHTQNNWRITHIAHQKGEICWTWCIIMNGLGHDGAVRDGSSWRPACSLLICWYTYKLMVEVGSTHDFAIIMNLTMATTTTKTDSNPTGRPFCAETRLEERVVFRRFCVVCSRGTIWVSITGGAWTWKTGQ